MEVEIKRCPFCGSVPKVVHYFAYRHFYVKCCVCGTSGPDSQKDGSNKISDKLQAIELWNKREDVSPLTVTLTIEDPD